MDGAPVKSSEGKSWGVGELPALQIPDSRQLSLVSLSELCTKGPDILEVRDPESSRRGEGGILWGKWKVELQDTLVTSWNPGTRRLESRHGQQCYSFRILITQQSWNFRLEG